MKHTLLVLSLFLSTLNLALAQLSIDPNPWIGTIEDVDLTDNWAEPIAHGEMVNTGTDPLSVRWELVILEAPEDWDFRVCDKNACYSTNTITNWDPANQIEEPVILAAGEEGLLDLHILPRTVAGTVKAEIRLSLTSDPNTVITTGTYEVTVSGPSSANEVSIQQVRIFPNPSTDYFALTSSQGVSKIMLYNVVGRTVRTFEAAEGKKYYIADLPDGMYLAGLIGYDGKVLRTLRISKRSLRP